MEFDQDGRGRSVRGAGGAGRRQRVARCKRLGVPCMPNEVAAAAVSQDRHEDLTHSSPD